MRYPTPYPELNAVLATFLEQTQNILLENFVGLYLTGSFALGGFDLHSDLDFVVVTHSELTGAQEAALQIMHGQIYDLEINWSATLWARHLEGSYISKTLLERPDPNKTPLFYLDNTARVLVRSTHCNTLVVRWTLREHGITLAGPDPKTLVEPTVPDELCREVAGVMQEWGAEISENPQLLENRWYQPYAVVTYCRMLYTVQSGIIISKPGAVRWGQEQLDSRWSGLIERAWLERPDPSLKSKQQADPIEARETLEFVWYVLELKDKYFVESSDLNARDSVKPLDNA